MKHLRSQNAVGELQCRCPLSGRVFQLCSFTDVIFRFGCVPLPQTLYINTQTRLIVSSSTLHVARLSVVGQNEEGIINSPKAAVKTKKKERENKKIKRQKNSAGEQQGLLTDGPPGGKVGFDMLKLVC